MLHLRRVVQRRLGARSWPCRLQSTNAILQCVAERTLPPFNKLRADEMVPAVRQAIQHLDRDIQAVEASLRDTTCTLSWENVMDKLEVSADPLERLWGIIGHLTSVKNTPELRAAHAELQAEVVTIFTRFAQSEDIFHAYNALKNDAATWNSFDQAQQRILEASIRSATLSGVGLTGAAKDRFNSIQLRSAELKTKFSNNVLDATKAFSRIVTNKQDLDGLPPSVLQLLAQNAAADGYPDSTADTGPWKLSLDMPCLLPVLKYATNRQLRKELYRANVAKAGVAPFDNVDIVRETLQLRQERAKMLGFNSYAELSLASKMAPSVAAVEEMIESLRDKCFGIAQKEFRELTEYAKQHGHDSPDGLRHWDVAFWAEKRRAALFDLDDEAVKPYFPLPKVLHGLFQLTERLFGVTVEAANGEADTWHSDVQFFHIKEHGSVVASFFLDPYARPSEKNGGAWMNTCVNRSRLLGPTPTTPRLPVAYLICNQSPPVGETPSLMTFREVETLFHEFGHGLQHMLTTVEYGSAAGINGVEWDAVELPSQFMENFCYHKETLLSISGHYETNAPLPEELYNKIKDARTYMAASGMLRQLNFGALDLYLHHHYDPHATNESVFDVQQRLAQRWVATSVDRNT
ncbi:hypothetical protein, variant [Aphanomyces invadans]|uniref:oligopeptidase A n=1 Tax=Aphanomyces invadans TaxID=157072 RepID=A0A024TVN6_9STRA|nr:hypothetical protein, variant [Aphanomyces invadans]ETV98044.1 hypothetical protein, variant [Aphanomyces invadans]|eukprot:XP_008873605.1 hypothetical protein, variant [Aphanomyces invadans]